jgi:eukaryotic-like serine/threonine-protein kinase
MRCGPRIRRVSKAAAQVGETAHRHRVLARLAVGGMAEIFLVRSATVTGVERYCVLKRILPVHAGDASFVRMFVDEARLATQLQHPNIASVYDVGILDNLYFYTMEYVHGETVRSLVERAQSQQRPLPLACVLTIIAGAAAGLQHAHARSANDGRPLGIVHRDVSPSNLMVSYEGNVKVIDFGVAKASDRAAETRSGTVKGKIYYLSPEQCSGERVDRRSDLFSLGIVMWEMLTGARLYRRATDLASMAAIVAEAPPPPSSLRPDVPGAVDAVALRLLAKSPADRFQTAAEVVEAIERASIRGGTILSTAAVGRLVHDLFGPRAEPWHALERERLTGDPAASIARPVASEVPIVSGSSAGGMRDAEPGTLSIAVSSSSLSDLPLAPEASRADPGTLSIDGSRSSLSDWPLAAPEASQPAGPRRASRAPRLVMAATCVAVSFAIALGVVIRGPSERSAPSGEPGREHGTAVPAAGSAPAAPVPPGAPREPERPESAAAVALPREPRDLDSIAVAIDSDPPGAQILVGRRVLGTTPYRGELARQAHDVTFVIRLASYAERTVVAHASQAVSEHVKLVRSATGKPVKPDPDRVVNPF